MTTNLLNRLEEIRIRQAAIRKMLKILKNSSPKGLPKAEKTVIISNVSGGVSETNKQRRDAAPGSVSWITVNGVHIPLNSSGEAVGGPSALKGKDFSGASSTSSGSSAGATSSKRKVASGAAAAADHIIKGASATTQAKYEQARENEQKITPDMEEIASELGAEMTGLEFSVKTASSVADKLKRKKADGKSEEEAIDSMNDIVRYTQLGKHSDLVKNAVATKEKLEQKGYEVTEIDNKYLKNDASYKSIHMTVTSPQGQSFELQFHSKESLAVKNENHVMYEEARKVGTTESRRQELNTAMRANTASLADPGDIGQLQNYKKS